MGTNDERKKLISEIIAYWSKDWNKFVRDALCARLDHMISNLLLSLFNITL